MIVGVGCWRGLGATTTAMLLAAALGERYGCAWLVEADAAGGSLAVRLGLDHDDLDGAAGLGIERLASIRPGGADAARVLHEAAVDVGPFVLVPAPADPFRAAPCTASRIGWVEWLQVVGAPVVVDVGRLRPGAVPWPIVARFDELLLVTTADAGAMVATDDWAAARGRVLDRDPGLGAVQARLVVVDMPSAAQRFTRAAALAELGSRLGGWMPWSPDGVAAVLAGAGLDHRRVRRRGLGEAARELAHAVIAASPLEQEVVPA